MTTASDAERVLTFPEGIPGFPQLHEFLLVEMGGEGLFRELRSIEDENVAMVVCVPWTFFPGYAPELSDTDQEKLGIERPEDAVIFCPVALDSASDTIYVNLMGPFVVNTTTRVGRQLVLTDSGYPVRAPLDFAEA